MKKYINLFTLLIILFLVASCDHNIFDYSDEKEHHQFFRCKIDGEEWTHYVYRPFISYYHPFSLTMRYYEDSTYYSNYESLNIYADYEPKEGINSSLSISVKNLQLGEINMNDELRVDPSVYSEREYNESNDLLTAKLYYLDSTYNNQLYIIDIDTLNNIIIGSFEFRAISKDAVDTVLVTDGEFDVFYNEN